MTAAPAVVDIGAAKPVRTSAYDGALPGSTWELDPGQTLRVELVNELPPLDHTDHPVEMDRPHEWTTTNLHTHGLHVSPEGDGDNVFVTIEPGERHQYEIEVPDDHPGGLFWYHPHRHGGVAQQIRGGMAGAIIVRGELDEVPEVAAAEERLMVIQAHRARRRLRGAGTDPRPVEDRGVLPAQPDPLPDQRPRRPDHHDAARRGAAVADRQRRRGQVHEPRARRARAARPGLGRPHPRRPGAGDQPVHVAGQPRRGARPGRRARHAAAGADAELEPEAGVRRCPRPDDVQPPARSSSPARSPRSSSRARASRWPCPPRCPAWDPPILPIARRRQVEYSVERDGLEFSTFGVDGEPFVPTQTPYQVRLDTAEEWTVVNGVDDKLPQHAHVVPHPRQPVQGHEDQRHRRSSARCGATRSC